MNITSRGCDHSLIDQTFDNISLSQYERTNILPDFKVAKLNQYIIYHIGVGMKDQLFEIGGPLAVKLLTIGVGIWESKTKYKAKFNSLSFNELLIKIGRNLVLYLIFLFALWLAKIIGMKVLIFMIAGLIFKIISDV